MTVNSLGSRAKLPGIKSTNPDLKRGFNLSVALIPFGNFKDKTNRKQKYYYHVQCDNCLKYSRPHSVIKKPGALKLTIPIPETHRLAKLFMRLHHSSTFSSAHFSSSLTNVDP